MTPVIAFIGGGNMAEAVFGGLYHKGHPSTHLRISEPVEARRQYLETTYPGVMATSDNHQAVHGANVVILAVKPQVLHHVVSDLAPTFHKNPSILLVSVAAGIETSAILSWINATEYQVPLVRTMPNTPALMSEGAVGLFATECVTQEQRQLTESVLGSVSKVLTWVKEESLVDTVTGVSGSGPAYFFLFMEAMTQAGVEAGLSEEESKALTVQTCLGAARMAQESQDDLATLRKKVTSPNGTTEAAIKFMESKEIRDIIKGGVFAATHRSKELAAELGKTL